MRNDPLWYRAAILKQQQKSRLEASLEGSKRANMKIEKKYIKPWEKKKRKDQKVAKQYEKHHHQKMNIDNAKDLLSNTAIRRSVEQKQETMGKKSSREKRTTKQKNENTIRKKEKKTTTRKDIMTKR